VISRMQTNSTNYKVIVCDNFLICSYYWAVNIHLSVQNVSHRGTKHLHTSAPKFVYSTLCCYGVLNFAILRTPRPWGSLHVMWSECQFIFLVHRTLNIYQSKIPPLSKLPCHYHDDTDFTIRHYFVLIPGQN